MSLSDRLAQRKTTASPTGCRTCSWLTTRTKQEQADFAAWIKAGLRTNILHEECVAEGLTVRLSAFRTHCRGECRDAK